MEASPQLLDALRAREAQLRALYEHAPDAVVVLRPDGTVVDANPAACRLHAIERGQLVGAKLLALVPPDHRQPLLKSMAALVRGDLEVAESVVLDTASHEVHVEVRAAQFSYDGAPAVLLQLRDVSASKRFEVNARQQEGLLRAVVESAPICLFAVDRSGLVTLAEGRSLRDLGLAREAYIGRRLTRILSSAPQLIAAMDEAFAGRPASCSIVVRRRSFEVQFVPAETGITGVATDVTELVAAKEAAEQLGAELRALTAYEHTVREEERARISREVHDVLGQALTALRMDAVRIERHLDGPREVLGERLAEMRALTEETIRTVRRIATELRPVLLDEVGLAAALVWQMQEYARRTGLDAVMSADDTIRFTDEQATALFRVFQEALTNVSRHAQASRVEGRLTREHDAGRSVAVLRVRDDGRGIRPEDLAQQRSLGLLGMRERVQPWGGTVAFEGGPGKGTTVVVRLPLSAEAEKDEKGERADSPAA
jgi:PAS domain S-box-containing protein